MKFPNGTKVSDALEAKRGRVKSRQKEFFDFWQKKVAPRYLDPWSVDRKT
jgi:hypothetical protein